MKTRTILYADKGNILTNGEAYGKIIYLAEGASPSDFYEITEDEYIKICEEKKNQDKALDV